MTFADVDRAPSYNNDPQCGHLCRSRNNESVGESHEDSGADPGHDSGSDPEEWVKAVE